MNICTTPGALIHRGDVGSIRVEHVGIDWMEYGVFAPVRKSIIKKCRKVNWWQETEDIEFELGEFSAQLPLTDNHECYSFSLRGPNHIFHVEDETQFSNRGKPNLLIKWRKQYLAQGFTLDQLEQEKEIAINFLCQHAPTRGMMWKLDLAADLSGSRVEELLEGLEEDDERWKTDAKKGPTAYYPEDDSDDGEDGETESCPDFGAGKSSRTRLSIYNKVRHILEDKPDDDWWFDVWKRDKSSDSPVFRFEFQHGREFLNNFSPGSGREHEPLAYWMENLGEVWRDDTQDFVTIREECNDSNSSRWDNHSVWQALVNLAGAFERLPEGDASDHNLLISLWSYVRSFLSRYLCPARHKLTPILDQQNLDQVSFTKLYKFRELKPP